jgi:protein-disulfide isomerase-like protein with CxxC motif
VSSRRGGVAACNAVAVSVPVTVVHLSDPGCPWAYAAAPALTLLRWRYGGNLGWRTVMIGLAEDPRRYLARGTTPASQAKGYRRFRRYGMPFGTEPRARVVATGRACRAVVATRLLDPGREDAAFRALQFAHFTSTLLFDTDPDLRTALATVPGLDAEAVVGALDDEAVEAAYQADRAEAPDRGWVPDGRPGQVANTDGSSATRRRRCASSIATAVASRRVASSPSRPTTC